MICPKCGQEIEDNVKFCTKCGVNISEEKERLVEEKRKKMKEEEVRQKELEDKKRLDEIRKKEEERREKEQKEAEKAEAIRQAKEEGIELEIIDEEEPKATEETNNSSEFKIKKDDNNSFKPQKEKKQKIRIKKNFFQKLFGKIIFIIIVAALIIGGVYYCYKQNLLPDFAQKQVKDFDNKLQNVIKLNKEVKENREKLPKDVEESSWKVEPNIEADDIKDLNKEVSIIVKDKKEGLINNKTGEVVLEAKYSRILISDYYGKGKTEQDKVNGIVVKDEEKFYSLDADYKISEEVTTIVEADKGAYFYDHHTPKIYFNIGEKCTEVKPDETKNGLVVCTDIDIVTSDGKASKDTDLPESFTIDFDNSKISTKGYFDISKAELTINCDYDEAYDFSEGYAAVKKGTKSGIIDEKGNTIVQFDYKETRSVHNGLAFARKDGEKWGILSVK